MRSDEDLVNYTASQMRVRLRAAGKKGWQNMSSLELRREMFNNLGDNDYLDVAIYAMMAHCNENDRAHLEREVKIFGHTLINEKYFVKIDQLRVKIREARLRAYEEEQVCGKTSKWERLRIDINVWQNELDHIGTLTAAEFARETLDA